MAKKHTTFAYEMLVRFMLAILDIFEITKVEEEITNEKDGMGTVMRILHIWLEARDLRAKVWHALRPNGFTEYRSFNDFPQREHKVLLHVRRRRWLYSENHSDILDTPQLVAEGTSYSAEFAGFLKKNGWIPTQ